MRPRQAHTAPAGRRHLRALPTAPLEYRRADGIADIPLGNDVESWIPPPPPYSRHPDPYAPRLSMLNTNLPMHPSILTAPLPATASTLQGYSHDAASVPNRALEPAITSLSRGNTAPLLGMTNSQPHHHNELLRSRTIPYRRRALLERWRQTCRVIWSPCSRSC